MVRRYLIYLLMLLPCSLFSGEFTASVNRNQVVLGESFTLNLKLTDASAKGSPSTSALNKSFVIHGQHQSSNTVITNGKMSSSINWQFTVIPQQKGELTIPSISIETSDGTLSSDPIQLQVTQRTASSGSDDDKGLTLTTNVSQAKPYKNEPIIYTVKLISKRDLANINMQKITIEDALVEMTGEPGIEERIIDGLATKIIGINYIITPLKVGQLTIPSTIIQGGIPAKRKSRTRSFFDDDFDAFSMLRHFDRLEPFALSTDEIVLEVQPPIADVNPWLPALSLTIEEKWDESQTLQVGEPLTRGFKIVAEGVKASQLPSLNDRQISDRAFKIYADKPEMDDHVRNGIVKSYRNEQYTLIPHQSGTLTLPEITIPWWDVTKHAIAYTTVPSRNLEVLPIPENTQQSDLPPTVGATHAITEPQVVVNQNNPLLYVLIAGLVSLLLFVFFWGFTLQKKIARLTDTPEKKLPKKIEKPLPIHLKELESISTAKELQKFLQSYANRQWKTSQNATLKIVWEATKKRCPTSLNDEISSIEKTLEDALYQDKEIDINAIVKRCSFVLEQTTKTASTNVKKEKLPDLNPS